MSADGQPSRLRLTFPDRITSRRAKKELSDAFPAVEANLRGDSLLVSGDDPEVLEQVQAWAQQEVPDLERADRLWLGEAPPRPERVVAKRALVHRPKAVPKAAVPRVRRPVETKEQRRAKAVRKREAVKGVRSASSSPRVFEFARSPESLTPRTSQTYEAVVTFVHEGDARKAQRSLSGAQGMEAIMFQRVLVLTGDCREQVEAAVRFVRSMRSWALEEVCYIWDGSSWRPEATSGARGRS